MSDRKKETGMDDMIHYFIKEMVKKGIEGFPPGAANEGNKARSPFDEMRDMMREAREKFREFRNDGVTEEVVSEVITTDAREMDLMQKEIDLLKEQIEMLKEQLGDKDEIIELLKEKTKTEHKASSQKSGAKTTRKKPSA